MGILDFLFEDNHRRPPRKKINHKTPAGTGNVKGHSEPESTVTKKTIKSSEFHKEKKELRIHDFRSKNIQVSKTFEQASFKNPSSPSSSMHAGGAKIKDLNTTGMTAKSATASLSNTESASTENTDLTFLRNKKLHHLIQKLLPGIKEALGENYKGTLAFDTLSDASVSDLMSPNQTFELHIKKAIGLFTGHPLGKPSEALIPTKDYLIYMYIKDRFIFNIFVSREDISEGILMHSLSRILKETN